MKEKEALSKDEREMLIHLLNAAQSWYRPGDPELRLIASARKKIGL